VTGKVTPDTVKPVPVSVAELIVSGAVPVDVNVTGWVGSALTATLPNDKLLELMLSVGTAAFNCRAKLADTLPELAVNFTA
jgi:hypothetical protein